MSSTSAYRDTMAHRHSTGKVLFERKPLGEQFIKLKRLQNDSDDGQLTIWKKSLDNSDIDLQIITEFKPPPLIVSHFPL